MFVYKYFYFLQKNMTSLETKKDIFLTIRTRGPHAFKNLLQSLRQSGHDNIAKSLEGHEFNSNNEKQVIPEFDYLRITSNSKEYEDYEEPEEYKDGKE